MIERRCPVGQQAGLREAGDLPGHGHGGGQCLAIVHQPVGQAQGEGLFGIDRPAGEDHVERPAHADEPRQPHRTTIDQRHAPAAAEHAEGGAAGGHAQVAHQRQLQATGDGITLDRSDHRLAERHSAGAHRPVRTACAFDDIACCRVGHRCQIGAGTEVACVASEHGHAQAGVGFKTLERQAQGQRGRAVDGIAPLGAAEGDRDERTIGFKADAVL